MDDQHNCPTDDAEKIRVILLQLDDAGREEVFAMIRERPPSPAGSSSERFRVQPPSCRDATIATHENNATQHRSVVDARTPVRHRKERLRPLHLRVRQPEQITQATPR